MLERKGEDAKKQGLFPRMTSPRWLCQIMGPRCANQGAKSDPNSTPSSFLDRSDPRKTPKIQRKSTALQDITTTATNPVFKWEPQAEKNPKEGSRSLWKSFVGVLLTSEGGGGARERRRLCSSSVPLTGLRIPSSLGGHGL